MKKLICLLFIVNSYCCAGDTSYQSYTTADVLTTYKTNILKYSLFLYEDLKKIAEIEVALDSGCADVMVVSTPHVKGYLVWHLEVDWSGCQINEEKK